MTAQPVDGGSGGRPSPPHTPERILGIKDTAEFVRQMLDSEVAHRDRLEQRASSLVASTGGLVTVTGAVGALFPRSTDLALPEATLYLFFAALGFFVLAIALSLVSGFRGADKGSPVPTGKLEEAMAAAISSPDDFAQKIVEFYGATVPTMRRWNKSRAAWLLAAAGAQMIAVVALAIAVALLLQELQGIG